MAVQLKVTPAELKNAAGEISGQIRQVENGFGNLEREINASRNYWEGDASNAHLKYYESFKDEIAMALRRLKEHPTDLLRMAGLYEDNEKEAVQIAASLSDDVIV